MPTLFSEQEKLATPEATVTVVPPGLVHDRELEPGLTVTGFLRRYPGSASSHADLFCDALARGGVPPFDRSGTSVVHE